MSANGGGQLPPRASPPPPPNNYSYGSIDVGLASPGAASEHDSLIGERLIATDNEDETPNNSQPDLQHLVGISGNSQVGNRSLTATPGTPKAGSRFGGVTDSVLNRSGKYPVGHVARVVLIMGVAICMCTFAWVLHPNASGAPMGGSPDPPNSRAYTIPFPAVDRAMYDDPASGIVDPDLFHPTLLYKPTERPKKTNSNKTVVPPPEPFLNVPLPTGAFWINFVLKPTPDHGLSYPIVSYPYAYKWSPSLLQVSYPPLRRRVDAISIRDTFNPDITFGAAETVIKRHIMKFDPLSVTVRFYGDNGGYWESYLVQGSPYITIKYQDATPLWNPLSIFRDVVCPFDEDGNYKDGQSFDDMSVEGDTNEATDETTDGRRLRWQARKTKFGVCSPSASSESSGGTATTKRLHGVQFLLQTQENLTWMVFASEPIELTFDTLTKRTVSSLAKFTGVLRIALVPPPIGVGNGPAAFSANMPLSKSTGVRRLVYHAGVYPVSGSVSWDYRPGLLSSLALSTKKTITRGTQAAASSGKAPKDKIATIQFHYETKAMTDNSNSNPNFVHEGLLLLALPHHAHVLSSDALLSSDKFDLVYNCIKGVMAPVLGDTWSYDEQLTSIGFDEFDTGRASSWDAASVDPGVRSTILEQVQKDLKRVLPTSDENVYGFGKQVARVAQLAHIAHVLSPTSNQTTGDKGHAGSFSGVATTAIKALNSFLVEFLSNDITDTLLYDANFGGIVTKNGLSNSEADFGNGRYNDHHFHYGYILYACAILGKWNSTFVVQYGSLVDALLFDVAHFANPDSQTVDDVFFPLARHKAWFDGHSFASGLFPFGNGKSQESSSEAVNCYYGAYLWSLVRFGEVDEGDSFVSKRTDFARLLLATEIRGAKTYWHMKPPDEEVDNTADDTPQIYNPIFRKNYMVGNVGMLDVVCSTWFGTASLYVHMINFVPVTAITGELFEEKYVQGEFTNIIGPLLPNVEMAWRGYVICDQAILDPYAAWTEAQDLVSYEMDSAVSKSQVLYWITTRGGVDFVPPSSESPPARNASSASGTKPNNVSESPSCEDNEACSSLGLSGLCCPTSEGVYLGCCNKRR